MVEYTLLGEGSCLAPEYHCGKSSSYLFSFLGHFLYERSIQSLFLTQGERQQ